jgi:phage-related protein
LNSTDFTFNGITSASKGVYIVRMDGGLISDPYWAAQKIREESIPNRHTPYFFGVQKQPLEFTLTLSTLNTPWNAAKRLEVATWLIHEDYKPFISADNANKIYYVICTNAVELMTGSGDLGYIVVNFRSKYPWAMTPVVETTDVAVTGGTNITMTNSSNLVQYYYPEMEFTTGTGVTAVSFTNVTAGNRVTAFTNLYAGETIYLNNERKQIITDVPSTYRYSNFNKNWLYLLPGENTITVSADITLSTRMQFPIAT